jgi:hypothetical protein
VPRALVDRISHRVDPILNSIYYPAPTLDALSLPLHAGSQEAKFGACEETPGTPRHALTRITALFNTTPTCVPPPTSASSTNKPGVPAMNTMVSDLSYFLPPTHLCSLSKLNLFHLPPVLVLPIGSSLISSRPHTTHDICFWINLWDLPTEYLSQTLIEGPDAHNFSRPPTPQPAGW